MKLKLCIPCAEQLKLGYSVHRVTAGSRKDTCCQCGKRRFCYDFEVGRKTEKDKMSPANKSQ